MIKHKKRGNNPNSSEQENRERRNAGREVGSDLGLAGRGAGWGGRGKRKNTVGRRNRMRGGSQMGESWHEIQVIASGEDSRIGN